MSYTTTKTRKTGRHGLLTVAAGIKKTRRAGGRRRVLTIAAGPTTAASPTTAPLSITTHCSQWRTCVECRADMGRTVFDEAYQTSIIPHLKKLKKAKHLDTADTYGEFSWSFVSYLLSEYGITETSSFVDLGSGVGNVVLQAYLEKGCQATGCELEEPRNRAAQCLLDTIKQKLTGLARGDPLTRLGTRKQCERKVTLQYGDIFEDKLTQARICQADLIICCDLKFSPEQIDLHKEHVLRPMKPGAVFVNLQQVITGRRRVNAELIESLGVSEEKKISATDAVMWTHTKINYWVYRKKLS